MSSLRKITLTYDVGLELELLKHRKSSEPLRLNLNGVTINCLVMDVRRTEEKDLLLLISVLEDKKPMIIQ